MTRSGPITVGEQEQAGEIAHDVWDVCGPGDFKMPHQLPHLLLKASLSSKMRKPSTFSVNVMQLAIGLLRAAQVRVETEQIFF